MLRAAHDAILVGIGTVLADNPRLTVRLVEGADPQPVVVDSRLRLPLDANLFSNPKAPWIAHINGAHRGRLRRATPLTQRGARLLPLPANAAGGVDLAALIVELGDQGVRSIMVEGGARIIAGLLQCQLVDYAVVTVAPRYVAGQRLPLQPHSSLSPSGLELMTPTYTQSGPDLILWGSLATHHNPAPPPLQPPLAHNADSRRLVAGDTEAEPASGFGANSHQPTAISQNPA
jgi:riboflavin-specific deaminase-like protein